jgi:hypothetical protein
MKNIIINKGTAEIIYINPLIPQSWGTLLNWGTPPGPPAGSILHLLFSILVRLI